jgi:hypothetical protein
MVDWLFCYAAVPRSSIECRVTPLALYVFDASDTKLGAELSYLTVRCKYVLVRLCSWMYFLKRSIPKRIRDVRAAEDPDRAQIQIGPNGKNVLESGAK